MSFGTNLAYLRKEKAITQERLAEMMSVSRQTVSRWEGDSVLPDVDTLVRLCDIFGCDLDSLVRGDVSAKETTEEATAVDYDNVLAKIRALFKRLALLISSGVFLIIGGVAAFLFVLSYTKSETFGIMVMLAFIAIGVGLIVYAGVSHSLRERGLPRLPLNKYHRDSFFNLIPWFFTVAVIFIILDIILLIFLLSNPAPNYIEQRSVGIFMAIIAVAVFMLVYAGVRMSEEGYITEKEEAEIGGRKKKLLESINSAIMMVATIVFLLLGFLKNLWHPAWVVFPVGGILTGVVSVIFGAVTGSDDDK